MKSYLLGFALLFISLPIFALPESTSLETMISYMEDGKTCDDGTDFWKRKSVEVVKNIYSHPTPFHRFGKILEEPNGSYRVRYSKYGCGLGTKGSIVVAPGRGESSVDYFETAIDFTQLGYSPVYVIDHRGQGLSPRLGDDQQKQHLVNYAHYITDMDAIVEEILEDLSSLGRSSEPLFLTTNSMGGGIALVYSISKQSKGQESPFTAMALLAPTIRVNYLSYVRKAPTKLNNLLYSEPGALAIAWKRCGIPRNCDVYAAEEFSTYKPTDFILTGTPSDENFMTHSKARYDFHRYLFEEFSWDEIKETEYGDENWQSVLIGGSTAGWVVASTPYFPYLRKSETLKKLPNVPMLVMTAEFDHRVYRPYFTGEKDENGNKVIDHDLKYHSDFCENVNTHNQHGNTGLCRFHEVKGAFHELYKETDVFRNEAISKVDAFFREMSQ